MFKCGKTITHIPAIKLYNERLHYNRSLRYLGLYFDPNLPFMPHLKEFDDEIISFNERLSRIARDASGLSPEIVKQIYLSVKEKIILYGVQIWYRNMQLEFSSEPKPSGIPDRAARSGPAQHDSTSQH
ncbi:hypothetical protein AVEN_215977-1 [Araneus ventricosus]|uniref:Uncharacterized protein n=1 Tax=Araneus ventricosus TaxID=182803 RepID=A0A4Y2W688_ARAVE|nr:hypothetical protein AVEN_114294-1 [Araneus ventricosus]GBO32530.1 hypothetical protein AVEN_119411-1 [Araneus ventricosus]GBO32532.1 hypothetical protein AVEN_159745-1 [Araneus ventricosus]GBO32537.1 hypothetical protein AVEN_215977-1 [Araneus ventricosus]